MTTRAHSNRSHSKTAGGNDRPGHCSICQQPARRVKPDLYANVYDVDCEQCGKYRIGGSGEAAVRSMGHAGLGARWLRLIARANADGDRLTIPGEMRIPLTQ